MKRTSILASILLAGVVSIIPKASAVPYASGVTNNSGVVSFILNENADNVKVLFNAGSVTNDLGAVAKGTTNFSLGSYTNYQIVVSKVAPPGFITANGTVNTVTVGGTNATGLTTYKITNNVANYFAINDDANPLLNFGSPRGIAINQNPKSPYFGRIYVSNSTNTALTDLGGVSRTTGDGIYLLNADLSDARGLGDTASTAGLDANFLSGGVASPYRLSLGSDDKLYICDWSDPDGNLFVTDPDVTTGGLVLQALTGSAATPIGVANTHGSISAAYISGTLSAGNLKVYTIDEDMQVDRTAGGTPTQANSLWRYDINGGPLPATNIATKLWTPTAKEGIAFASGQIVDLDRGTNGYFYASTYRSSGNECGIVVRNTAGTSTLWYSYNASTNFNRGTTNDLFLGTYAMAVSPDQTYAAAIRADGRTWILPLTNGIPDISRRLWLDSFPAVNFSRGVRFDAAGNLYALSSGQAMMRAFSPGGNTVATTGNDSTGTNGTFKVQRIDPWIYTQPQNVTTNAGANVSLTIVATGPDLSYQWQFNGVNIASATNTILTFSNVQRTNVYGTYKCIVTSTTPAVTNSIASQTVLLNVLDTLPIITAQSLDTSTNAGTSPKFTVTAVGSPTLTYQWYFEGNPISAATNTSYTVSNAQQTNAGNYYVVVGNFFGPTTSTNIALTVVDGGPVITTQPKGVTNGAGVTVTMTVASTGSDPRTYQWSKDGSNLPGATGTSFSITNAQFADAGGYMVSITNAFDFAQSITTQVNITNTPNVIITTQPKGLTNGAGVNLAFSTVAIGNGPLAYQWYTNSTAVLGATNSAYTWVNPQVEDSGSTIYVTIGNATPSSIQSASVLIGVTNKVPTIITQPVDFAGVSGGSATNVVVAQGQNPLTYQWKLGTVAVAGATDATLVLNNLQATNAGSYTVVVTDSAGNTTSSAVLLAVAGPSTPGTGTGLTGEYFSNQWYLFASPNNSNSISITPTLTRTDATVDFLWGTGSPDPTISTDYFVVRWSGQVQPLYSENHTFYVKSDDGIRLWVGGRLVIDQWTASAKNVSVLVTNLVAGQKYDIRLEYLDITSTAECHLLWSSTNQLKQPIQSSQLYPVGGPIIVTQPVGTITTNGLSASFSVTTDLSQPATGYQLLFNSNLVSSGTSATFTLNNVQMSDIGLYQIVATNSYGSTTSGPVLLTVVAPSNIGTGTGLTGDYFSSLASTAASSATSSFTNAPTLSRLDSTVDFAFGSWYPDPAISADTFVVRWTGQIQPQFSQVYKFYTRSDEGLRLWVDGILIIDHWANGLTNTHSYNATMPYAFVADQKYSIRLEYFDVLGNAEAHLMWSSGSQPLQVIPTSQLYPQGGAFAIVHPKNSTVLAGNSTNLTVVAGGGGTYTYQWMKGGTNINGATTSSLPLNTVSYADNGSTYSVLVANGIGSRVSSNAVLTVTSPPIITTDPQSQAVALGSTATFSITVTGTAPFTYQWKKDGSNLGGATLSALSITNVQSGDLGGYSVGVTNSLGGVVSASATLSISSTTATPPTVGSVSVAGNNLSFSFATETGHSYTIQFKADLSAPTWVDVETFAGTGGTVNKNYSTGSGNGFYRIVVQ